MNEFTPHLNVSTTQNTARGMYIVFVPNINDCYDYSLLMIIRPTSASNSAVHIAWIFIREFGLVPEQPFLKFMQ